ncbi:TMEM175 family protein [Streptomyces sp. CA2R106]|uniref:TMEM175 family protein n=1 Tax=Streptomyces sp. CA2R106 TaxID=3120153 RepID=UPI003009DF32
MGANGTVDEIGTERVDTAEPPAPGSGKIEGTMSGERLVFFTDAVTAISITLLVLPLVDLVPEVSADHKGASEVITGHLGQIWSFLLSFAVVANVWREHHRAFSAVTRLTRALVIWNMGWLLAVVVLPLPTEMIGTFGRDRFAGGFYYATLLATMVCRLAMLRILKSTPQLLEEDGRGARVDIDESFTESYWNVIALVAAFAIALAVPVLQYYSLVLLILPRRVLKLRARTAA